MSQKPNSPRRSSEIVWGCLLYGTALAALVITVVMLIDTAAETIARVVQASNP